MLAWTIEEAKKSRYITRIIVNTEDEEIASVARQYGAEVFDRPEEFAQDLSTDFEVFYHQIKTHKEEGYTPDVIIQLRPNIPLRMAEEIDEGVKIMLESPEADSVRQITESPKHPYKMWKTDGEWLKPFLGEDHHGIKDAHDLPRQKLPKVYVHTASVDIMRPSTILEKKSMTGTKVKYFILKGEWVNIDNMIDFSIAEQLLMKRKI